MTSHQSTAFQAPCRVASDCSNLKYYHRRDRYYIGITLNVGLE